MSPNEPFRSLRLMAGSDCRMTELRPGSGLEWPQMTKDAVSGAVAADSLTSIKWAIRECSGNRLHNYGIFCGFWPTTTIQPPAVAPSSPKYTRHDAACLEALPVLAHMNWDLLRVSVFFFDVAKSKLDHNVKI